MLDTNVSEKPAGSILCIRNNRFLRNVGKLPTFQIKGVISQNTVFKDSIKFVGFLIPQCSTLFITHVLSTILVTGSTNKAGIIRTNVALRRVHITTLTVKKQ